MLPFIYSSRRTASCIGLLLRTCQISSSWVLRLRAIDEYGRARLARFASGTVGSHVSHAAYVDADRRQDSPGPHPAGKPLVEYGALCEYARFDDFTDPVPWERV